jgi:hypothetical protein
VSVKPHLPVDIHAPDTSKVESRAAGAAGLVPTAALVFGALVWLSLPFALGQGASESEGVMISWLAIFPTVFGFTARALRTKRLAENKPAVAMPFLVGAGAGVLGVLLMAFFYAAIWPSL